MKTLSKLLICLFVCAPLLFVKAASDKYFVPDPNLRTALKKAYPSCFTTTDSLIKFSADTAAKTTLNISGRNIASLRGIEFFTQLKTLDCSFNNLTTVSTLPAGLTSFKGNGNCFCPSLPVQPAGVTTWTVFPNKAECNVHFTVGQTYVKTFTELPTLLKVGKALKFDGVDDYYDIPGYSPGISSFSIMFWMKADELPSQLNYPLLQNTIGSWNHIAIVYTQNTGLFSIYVNGELKVRNQTTSAPTIQSMLVGYRTNKYKGIMNCLKVFVGVYHPSGIPYQMYRQENAWKMNEGSGSTSLNPENSNALIIHGASWVDENTSLTYKWSPADHLSATTGDSVMIISPTGKTYNHFTATATNARGCNASYDITVRAIAKGDNFTNPIEVGKLDSVLSYTNTQNTNFDGFSNDIGGNGNDVFYSFTLKNPATVKITPYGSSIVADIYLFDSNKNLVNSKEGWDEYPYKTIDMYLQPGLYYAAIEGHHLYNGNLKMNISTDFCNSPIGSTKSNPIVITDLADTCINYSDTRTITSCYGNDYGNEAYDIFYKVTLNSPQQLIIKNCKSAMAYTQIYVINSEGTVMVSSSNDNNFGCGSYNKSYLRQNLPAGTYYIILEGDYYYKEGEITLEVSTNSNFCGPKKYFVPDNAFRTALKTNYPQCFTGDSLIKACSDTASKTKLNIIGRGISNLQGIELFTNLQSLYCGSNNLKSISELPAKLTYINASGNCFCNAIPVKAISIPASNWIFSPNKSSCLVHVSTAEPEVVTEINKPVALKVGKALSFDGVDDYYSIPSLPNTTGPFTIEFWAKPVQLPSQLNYNELQFIVNQWNHIAIVKNGSTLNIYQNGELKLTKTIPNGQTVNIDSMLIGHGSNKYKGLMNDLKIWKSVRSQSELRSSMYSFNDSNNPNLIGDWKMSNGTGTVIKDYSFFANNGTISGCTWLNEDNSFTFTWSPTTKLSGSTGRIVNFTNSEVGTFDYTVTATNPNGCKASKVERVIIKAAPGVNFTNPIYAGVLNEVLLYTDTRYLNSGVFRDNVGQSASDVFYSFTLTKPTTLYIDHCLSKTVNTAFYLYNSNKSLLASREGFFNAACKSEHKASGSVFLLPGYYYLASEGYYNDFEDYSKLTTRIKATEVCDILPVGSTISNPIEISDNVGSCFNYLDKRGNYCYGNEHGQPSNDIYYKFTLTSPQQVTLSTCGSPMGDTYMYILNSAGKQILSSNYVSPITCDEPKSSYQSKPFLPGTYYVVTEGDFNLLGEISLKMTTGGACSTGEPEITDIDETSIYTGSISLYPNPTNGKTNLNIPGLTEVVSVKITDVSGKTTQTLIATSSLTEINTENLTDGMYYISFTYQNRNIVHKLIVTK